MSEKSALGQRGEDAAARHLTALGYAVLERNFRCRHGEIDLIVRRGPTIVFVEVKTRSTDHFGLPVEAVRGPKQTRIRRCAATWLDSHRPWRADIRFDVVSVIVRGQGLEVTHYPEAF